MSYSSSDYSPGRPTTLNGPTPPDDLTTPHHQQLGHHHLQQRPTSSGGPPSSSQGFTMSLGTVAEQPPPQLAPFEELTGEDLNHPHPPGSSAGLDGYAAPASIFGGAAAAAATAGGVGVPGGLGDFGVVGSETLPSVFRNPFSHSLDHTASPATQQPLSSAAYAAQTASSHLPFNPRQIHPNVNASNSRPLTAPSQGYNAAYSMAPSSFYAPAVQSTYETVPGYAHGGSDFQYQVDSAQASLYGDHRGRMFSLPEVVGGGAGAGAGGGAYDSGVEESSPTNSYPFFYAPPTSASAAQNGAGGMRPVTAGAAYYAPVFDAHPPSSSGRHIHPLSTSASHMLPPPPTSSHGYDHRPGTSDSLGQRRRSSGLSDGPSSGAGGNKSYNFIQQAGQATKRPRRRYDEIERLYNCDYPGCTKAYGTLNHLNSHRTMQKHGPKATPGQFKEMRKAWRERKKSEAAAAARARAAEEAAPAPTTHLSAQLPPPPPHLHPHPNFVLPASAHASHDRLRPSTSAGEYHFTMPAPSFMPSMGAPVSLFAHQPQPQTTAYSTQQPPSSASYLEHLHTQQPQQFAMPQYTSAPSVGLNHAGSTMTYDPYAASLVSSTSSSSAAASRPFTAPSYHVPPSFGSSSSSYGQQLPPSTSNGQQYRHPSSSSSSANLHATTVTSTSSSSTPSVANNERRYSLPGESNNNSPDSLKMPQPVLGYQNQHHVALLGGGGADSAGGVGGTTLGRRGSLLATGGGSLSLGSGGGTGAARLVAQESSEYENGYGGAEGS